MAIPPYEKLRGTVYFDVDPSDRRNAQVFDLDKAPRNEKGMVEFSAEFLILKPVDLKRGNHELFFEMNNRGNKLSPILMNDIPPGANNNNPTTARDFGNGFLLRQGYTRAWVGWQADVLPVNNRLTLCRTDGRSPSSSSLSLPTPKERAPSTSSRAR